MYNHILKHSALSPHYFSKALVEDARVFKVFFMVLVIDRQDF